MIESIEEQRGSRVLVYVTGDRAPARAQIGDDALRPLYAHLREMGRVDKLDLLIYSRGGAIDVPWRVVSAFRQMSKSWSILIPFRANSAATLLALGADQIVMGKQGELGPIDPILSIRKLVQQQPGVQAVAQEDVSVEDVMAYTKFIQERAGLSDQDALAGALEKLTDRLDAVVIGNAYRTHLHIRDVARRMLTSRKKKPTEQVIATIIETLAERVYAHGHAIGLSEAEEIGLPVIAADDNLDQLMWDLLGEYEEQMNLLQPLDPVTAVATTDVHREASIAAVIESSWAVHEFAGELEVRARRAAPPQLNVTLNLNLQLPSNITAAQLPAAMQQQLQQLQQGLLQQAQQAMQQALQEQAPLIGAEAALRGAVWKQSP